MQYTTNSDNFLTTVMALKSFDAQAPTIIILDKMIFVQCRHINGLLTLNVLKFAE